MKLKTLLLATTTAVLAFGANGVVANAEELPPCDAGEHLSNSDPVTGQAAWFDVRVKVYKADANEPNVTFPQFRPQRRAPGQDGRRGKWQAYFAGLFRRKAGIE